MLQSSFSDDVLTFLHFGFIYLVQFWVFPNFLVKNFTTHWKRKQLPLHMLVNNAGLGATEVTVTEDGYETVFATNHLGVRGRILLFECECEFCLF